MHVWALGLSCETPAAPPVRAAGARTRQPENSKRAHFRAPALQTPPKFHVRTPRERKKKKIVAGKGKKNAKFWAPHPSGLHPSGSTLRAPPFGAPTLRGPTFSRFGPPPSGPPPCGGSPLWSKNSTSKNWPKSKLAEVEIGRTHSHT